MFFFNVCFLLGAPEGSTGKGLKLPRDEATA